MRIHLRTSRSASVNDVDEPQSDYFAEVMTQQRPSQTICWTARLSHFTSDDYLCQVHRGQRSHKPEKSTRRSRRNTLIAERAGYVYRGAEVLAHLAVRDPEGAGVALASNPVNKIEGPHETRLGSCRVKFTNRSFSCRHTSCPPSPAAIAPVVCLCVVTYEKECRPKRSANHPRVSQRPVRIDARKMGRLDLPPITVPLSYTVFQGPEPS
jgi:hypothetical protein